MTLSPAPGPHPPLVEVRGLTKQYGATRALAGIDFRISRGEVVGFLGPNGAGKSTTMKILTGYLRPSGGQALVDGIDVASDPLATRRKIGYLPENAPLYTDMMVLSFLEYIAKLRGVAKSEIRPRLKGICERCGLMEVLGKDIGQLSKGYRQRVGLAQAIVHDPDLIILDEPTSGLDPNQIVEIRALIRDLGREKTVILSTHILPEVQATCGRVIIINQGCLVADDTPEKLMGQERGSVVRIVVKTKEGGAAELALIQRVFGAGAVPGVRDVTRGENELTFNLRTVGTDDPREQLFRAAMANELLLLDLHREQSSFEETFRRLTRGAPHAAPAEGNAP